VSEPASSEALRVLRVALSDTPAWLVGGAPRDRALGRETFDFDVIVDGPPADAARAIARAAGGAACFELSEDFSGWRIVARNRSWQVDVQPLRGSSLPADLELRDFTVGAIAEPVAGGEPIDPLGGLADLAARRLRMAYPGAFIDDPLRVLRLVRLALELRSEPDPGTARAARAAASDLRHVAGERIFMELRRIIASPRVLDGLNLMDSLGITAVVLPELHSLRGMEQSRFHHRDVHGHTLEVLERTVALQANPADVLGAPELAESVAALLVEPLADELTRGDALRWGALLAETGMLAEAGMRAGVLDDDVRGAELARSVLQRLRASERLRAHVEALVRHHLRFGFLLHAPQPLARRTVFDYLQATAPVEVDVTLLSVADCLAGRNGDAGRVGDAGLTGDASRRRVSTRFGKANVYRIGPRRVSPGVGRGEHATESIEVHMRLARALLADALRWRTQGSPPPLWRGDELAAALDIPTGPRVGEILRELQGAQYAGEISTPEQALAHARQLMQAGTI
jgi:tRNA nucleotidyltransferase/poly(A) polymerase